MSGITQEEIEQAQAREEQGNHDDHCRRDKDNEHGPLPGCPVWCGCKIEEVSR